MSQRRNKEKIMEEKECSISSDTFRRLYLLNIISGFRRGAYGLKRLHKISYISERQLEESRPFEFKRYYHGQYSETLDMVKDQLISLGLVAALPLDTAKVIRFETPDEKSIDLTIGGNTYIVIAPEVMGFYRDAFARISPELKEAVHRAIQQYGYLPEEELLRRCYDFPEFVETDFDNTIFESSLPDRVATPNLSPEDCEELELSLNPKFTSAMVKIVEGIERSKIAWDRIAVIDTIV